MTTQSPNAIISSKSPVFDTICALAASLPNNEVIKHDHQIKQVNSDRLKNNNLFYIFSYRQDFDFDKLWKNVDIEFSAFTRINEKTSYSTIIIWDGYPEKGSTGAVPIENWVTPIDWAVCAALSFSGRKEKPNWRVLIIDLVSQNHPGARSVSLLKANSAMIPWLRIYRPVISEKESELNQFDTLLLEEKYLGADRYALLRAMTKDDFASLIEDIRIPERVLGLNSSYDTLDALAAIWRANIVQPGDRHQIANLVAPLILLEALKNRQTPNETFRLESCISNSLTLALTEQLKRLQLLTLPAKGKGNQRARALTSVRDGLNSLSNEIDFQIYLIDDQYPVGYSDILDFVVDTPGKIICCDSAAILFGKLRDVLECRRIDTPGWRKPLFDKATILLLDLRLWFDTSKEQLASFHDALIKIGNLYQDNIKEPFKETRGNIAVVLDEQRKAWADDWTIVKKNITDQKDIEDLLALTMLPRLLSIVDPFLPIIVFSSSAQRQTLEAFAGYPNIITDFRKPMPTGYGTSLDPMEAVNDLAKAFQKSIQICRIKFIGDYISNLDRALFIDDNKIIYDKFKAEDTLEYNVSIKFDRKIVSADLHKSAMHLLNGEHRFSIMLPFFLMERWYKNLTKKEFQDIMPDADYWLLANPRNHYAHGDIFCLEQDSTDIDKMIVVWNDFIKLLKIVPNEVVWVLRTANREL